MKRILSPFNYLQALQSEFLIAKFRLAIYENPRDIEYLKKSVEYKEKRILDLGQEHNFVTLFSNKNELLNSEGEKFLKGNGIPIFNGLCKKDIFSYYSLKAKFGIVNESGTWTHFFMVNEVFLKEGTLWLIHIANRFETRMPFSHVKRVFIEKIF